MSSRSTLVMTAWRRPMRATTARDACRLERVVPGRLAGLDVAEAAAPRAGVAEDHERRGAALPALADVRAGGLLADRVEVLRLDQRLQLAVARPAGGGHLEPRRLAALVRLDVRARAPSGRPAIPPGFDVIGLHSSTQTRVLTAGRGGGSAFESLARDQSRSWPSVRQREAARTEAEATDWPGRTKRLVPVVRRPRVGVAALALDRGHLHRRQPAGDHPAERRRGRCSTLAANPCVVTPARHAPRSTRSCGPRPRRRCSPGLPRVARRATIPSSFSATTSACSSRRT